MELKPMDVVVSYKPIPGKWWPPKDAWWWPPSRILEHIADWCIIEYGKKLYGEEADVKYNHVRMYIGKMTAYDFVMRFVETEKRNEVLLALDHPDEVVEVGLEWTSPCARLIVWKDWMTADDYAKVYRYIGHGARDVSPVELLREFLEKYEGKLYDFLQLLAIGTGIMWLDFGKDHNVCSVGGRKIAETTIGRNMDVRLDVERTPPCWWPNVACWGQVTE